MRMQSDNAMISVELDADVQRMIDKALASR